jgi:hypothetical protein
MAKNFLPLHLWSIMMMNLLPKLMVKTVTAHRKRASTS